MARVGQFAYTFLSSTIHRKPGQSSNRLCEQAGESTPELFSHADRLTAAGNEMWYRNGPCSRQSNNARTCPNLFPVMTIGRHYEDRRAQERRIFPSSPEYGRHGVFLLYSALAPSPTIWAFSRGFYFQLHESSWDLRFWAWTVSPNLPSKYDLDHLDGVPGCWMIQVRNQVRARKVAFSPSQPSSEKWDTLLHALTSAIQKIFLNRGASGSYFTACTAESLAWSAQHNVNMYRVVVSFRTLPLVPGDSRRLCHDTRTMGRYGAAPGTLSHPSSRVIRTSTISAARHQL